MVQTLQCNLIASVFPLLASVYSLYCLMLVSGLHFQASFSHTPAVYWTQACEEAFLRTQENPKTLKQCCPMVHFRTLATIFALVKIPENTVKEAVLQTKKKSKKKPNSY